MSLDWYFLSTLFLLYALLIVLPISLSRDFSSYTGEVIYAGFDFFLVSLGEISVIGSIIFMFLVSPNS